MQWDVKMTSCNSLTAINTTIQIIDTDNAWPFSFLCALWSICIPSVPKRKVKVLMTLGEGLTVFNYSHCVCVVYDIFLPSITKLLNWNILLRPVVPHTLRTSENIMMRAGPSADIGLSFAYRLDSILDSNALCTKWQTPSNVTYSLHPL